jgi:iron complex transport system substrate-binding protein
MGALVLAGCGMPGASALTATSGATRIITDMAGREVEIPVSPKRVVIMSDRELAALAITLGYVPFGIVAGDPDYIERLSSLGGPQGDLSQMKVLSVGDPDLEAIAAAEPDLIFQASWAVEEIRNEFELLQQIAPVVAIEARANPDFLAPQRLMADILGLSDILNQRIADYEGRIAVLSSEFNGALDNATYNIMDQYSPESSNYVYDLAGDSAWWPAAIVLADLGAKPVPSILREIQGGGSGDIGTERVAEFDADLVFLATLNNQPADPVVLDLMQNTKAAQNGQLFQINAEFWSFAAGIEARFRVIEDLERLLGGRELVTGQFSE